MGSDGCENRSYTSFYTRKVQQFTGGTRKKQNKKLPDVQLVLLVLVVTVVKHFNGDEDNYTTHVNQFGVTAAELNSWWR